MDANYAFPGMDPFLEAPDIWPDFHDSLAAAIRSELNARLPEPYYARLQMRPELGIVLEEGAPHRIVPDVVIVRPRASVSSATTAALIEPRTAISEGIALRVHTDPFQHRFVEIRDAARGHKLIGLIEIVSPANKRPGPDRRAYETKQREVLETDAHLIELDLQRGGTRLLPYPELVAGIDQLAPDYLVLLNRANLRQANWMDYTLYPIRMEETLPVIPVPLTANDSDIPLDLQIVARRVYIEGPYRRALDYSQPPPPPDLTAENTQWINDCLQRAGWRP